MYRVIWQHRSDALGPLRAEALNNNFLPSLSVFSDFALIGPPEPVFARPALALRARLQTLAPAMLEERGEDLDLATYHHAFVHDLEAALHLQERLLGEPGVRRVEIQARPVPAVQRDFSIRRLQCESAAASLLPIPTPDFESHQVYLEAAPEGIDARSGWSRPGGFGDNIRIIDIEYGWNFAHEDLLDHQIGVIHGANGLSDHGTAVLGILSGDSNGHGVTGIVPAAVVGAASAIYDFSLQRWSAGRAIEFASRFLSAGDILVLEMHAPGPRSTGHGQEGFLPVEFWADDHAAIQMAVAQGIYVVEAAGNGGEDFDHPIYGGRLSRAADSGALMIGGGASAWQPDPLSRLSWSNYGERLDLQGWGSDIVTTGGREPDYHDLFDHPYGSRCYTQSFGGTSGATPIVAGAVAAIAGSLKAAGQPPLPPNEMRRLLIATGTPQRPSASAPLSQAIGPLPNLAAALTQLGL